MKYELIIESSVCDPKLIGKLDAIVDALTNEDGRLKQNAIPLAHLLPKELRQGKLVVDNVDYNTLDSMEDISNMDSSKLIVRAFVAEHHDYPEVYKHFERVHKEEESKKSKEIVTIVNQNTAFTVVIAIIARNRADYKSTLLDMPKIISNLFSYPNSAAFSYIYIKQRMDLQGLKLNHLFMTRYAYEKKNMDSFKDIYPVHLLR